MVCVCLEGYQGKACSKTVYEHETKQKIRETLAITLLNMTAYEAITTSAVVSRLNAILVVTAVHMMPDDPTSLP